MLCLKRKPGTSLVLFAEGVGPVTIHFRENNAISIDAPLSVQIKRQELITPPAITSTEQATAAQG